MVFDSLANGCLLYTSDAADDLLCVDLGGRRIIYNKNAQKLDRTQVHTNVIYQIIMHTDNFRQLLK